MPWDTGSDWVDAVVAHQLNAVTRGAGQRRAVWRSRPRACERPRQAPWRAPGVGGDGRHALRAPAPGEDAIETAVQEGRHWVLAAQAADDLPDSVCITPKARPEEILEALAATTPHGTGPGPVAPSRGSKAGPARSGAFAAAPGVAERLGQRAPGSSMRPTILPSMQLAPRRHCRGERRRGHTGLAYWMPVRLRPSRVAIGVLPTWATSTQRPTRSHAGAGKPAIRGRGLAHSHSPTTPAPQRWPPPHAATPTPRSAARSRVGWWPMGSTDRLQSASVGCATLHGSTQRSPPLERNRDYRPATT